MNFCHFNWFIASPKDCLKLLPCTEGDAWALFSDEEVASLISNVDNHSHVMVAGAKYLLPVTLSCLWGGHSISPWVISNLSNSTKGELIHVSSQFWARSFPFFHSTTWSTHLLEKYKNFLVFSQSDHLNDNSHQFILNVIEKNTSQWNSNNSERLSYSPDNGSLAHISASANKINEMQTLIQRKDLLETIVMAPGKRWMVSYEYLWTS